MKKLFYFIFTMSFQFFICYIKKLNFTEFDFVEKLK